MLAFKYRENLTVSMLDVTSLLCFLVGATNCDVVQPRTPHLSHVSVPPKHEGAWERARLTQDPFQPALSEVCLNRHL